jgi:hypothetical protein
MASRETRIIGVLFIAGIITANSLFDKENRRACEKSLAYPIPTLLMAILFAIPMAAIPRAIPNLGGQNKIAAGLQF